MFTTNISGGIGRMKLQTICLWKKVFSMNPDELPDAMFLQPSSECSKCRGDDLVCPDYMEIFENTEPEVMVLKYRSKYRRVE